MTTTSDTTAFSIGLSPLVGGSRQFVITIQEGEQAFVSQDLLCNTSARSNVGVGTALTLLSYEQVPPVDGVSLIKSGGSETGNGGVICVGGSSLESYAGSSGYSTGTSTIVVATAGNGEKISLTYDTASLSSGTLSAPLKYFSTTFVTSATEAVLKDDFVASNTASDIVFAKVATDTATEWRLCVRKGSALYETLLANFTGTSTETSFKLIFDYNQVIECRFSEATSAVIHEFTPTIENILTFTPKTTGVWSSFIVRASFQSSSALTSTDVTKLIFGTTTPTIGQSATIPPKKIEKTSVKRRAIKCVFNATQIFSESQSHYGGGISTR